MKELTLVSTNMIYAQKDDNEFDPRPEVILVISEPKWTISNTGSVVRERVCETVRFCVGSESIGALVESMLEIAKEIDDFKKSGRGKPPEVK